MFLTFKMCVKNIQTAVYDGARTVFTTGVMQPPEKSVNTYLLLSISDKTLLKFGKSRNLIKKPTKIFTFLP